jgi:hypothetical protein
MSWSENSRVVTREKQDEGAKKVLSPGDVARELRRQTRDEVQERQKGRREQNCEIPDGADLSSYSTAEHITPRLTLHPNLTPALLTEMMKAGELPAGRTSDGVWRAHNGRFASWYKNGGRKLIDDRLAAIERAERDSYWEEKEREGRDAEKQKEYRIAARLGGKALEGWKKRWDEIEAAASSEA